MLSLSYVRSVEIRRVLQVLEMSYLTDKKARGKIFHGAITCMAPGAPTPPPPALFFIIMSFSDTLKSLVEIFFCPAGLEKGPAG